MAYAAASSSSARAGAAVGGAPRLLPQPARRFLRCRRFVVLPLLALMLAACARSLSFCGASAPAATDLRPGGPWPAPGAAGAARRAVGLSRRAGPKEGAEKKVDFWDRPILNPNEKGGPLEPLKQFVRDQPDLAPQVLGVSTIVFSLIAISAIVRFVSFVAMATKV
eukprot:CAMPEP_0183503290 /NCGR_PEP_ID=MMETSP0371-20130417/5002_1 /TAXON_ID=268820 /ORGANISM="Peridinium aciculiferum, Strain PAER-2" /LENGTH=165 /DNA_ID=CAMNT_0025698347 /DNA_START=51 /DNA_END=548 /DNA_ORIENTATION=+